MLNRSKEEIIKEAEKTLTSTDTRKIYEMLNIVNLLVESSKGQVRMYKDKVCMEEELNPQHELSVSKLSNELSQKEHEEYTQSFQRLKTGLRHRVLELLQSEVPDRQSEEVGFYNKPNFQA